MNLRSTASQEIGDATWRPAIRKQPIDDTQPSVHPSAACITQETINRDLEDLDILATSCDAPTGSPSDTQVTGERRQP
jgi:hypothetical protein